ncbi:MAG: hypothetical protein LH628_11530 [Microcoleus sp. CAN_BIN18]|nr:hypothetical protein [Microcoleus sp. CAN_BIN18]
MRNNYPLPITDYQLPITNYQLPITNYRLPITDYQLPITNRKPIVPSISGVKRAIDRRIDPTIGQKIIKEYKCLQSRRPGSIAQRLSLSFG